MKLLYTSRMFDTIRHLALILVCSQLLSIAICAHIGGTGIVTHDNGELPVPEHDKEWKELIEGEQQMPKREIETPKEEIGIPQIQDNMLYKTAHGENSKDGDSEETNVLRDELKIPFQDQDQNTIINETLHSGIGSESVKVNEDDEHKIQNGEGSKQRESKTSGIKNDGASSDTETELTENVKVIETVNGELKLKQARGKLTPTERTKMYDQFYGGYNIPKQETTLKEKYANVVNNNNNNNNNNNDDDWEEWRHTVDAMIQKLSHFLDTRDVCFLESAHNLSAFKSPDIEFNIMKDMSVEDGVQTPGDDENIKTSLLNGLASFLNTKVKVSCQKQIDALNNNNKNIDGRETNRIYANKNKIDDKTYYDENGDETTNGTRDPSDSSNDESSDNKINEVSYDDNNIDYRRNSNINYGLENAGGDDVGSDGCKNDSSQYKNCGSKSRDKNKRHAIPDNKELGNGGKTHQKSGCRGEGRSDKFSHQHNDQQHNDGDSNCQHSSLEGADKDERVDGETGCSKGEGQPYQCIDVFSQESVISQLCTKMARIENGNKGMTSLLNLNQQDSANQLTAMKDEISGLKRKVELLARSSIFYAEASFGSSRVTDYKVKVVQGEGFEPASGYFVAPYDGVYQITVGYMKKTKSTSDVVIHVMLDNNAIFRLLTTGSEQQRMFMTSMKTGQSLCLMTNVAKLNSGLDNVVYFGAILVK